MKTRTLKPVVAAAMLALAASGAMAQKLDFSGSNIYMKFLDGDRRLVNANATSGDTASGTDQGQWTEFELRIKATISRQVEAGVRLQSRSSSAYWTDFGFNNNEGFGNGTNPNPNAAKYMKLRGAYLLLTPGYSWLDQALLGSSDWGMFDPFTVGQVRYIDRDNYNGLYFKGALPLKGATWEFGRLSLPNYLQNNYGQGVSCCSSDATQFNEAVYIGQVKGTLGPVKLATSYQQFNDHVLSGTGNDLTGLDTRTFARSQVGMLKGEGSVAGIDLKGAVYGSKYRAPLFDQPWINSPKSDVRGKAIKLDAAFAQLPVPGLSVNYQYFDIGAGFYSNTAARRESDVLLTEGSEAAWYGWGQSIWLGGAAKDYQQAPSSAHCWGPGSGGRCRGDSGLAAGANGLVDNAFMDFDEAPSESVQGWRGHTVVVNYEVAKIPMSLELTRIGYSYNWQNNSPQDPLSNFFALNNDRSTNLGVFKIGYVVPAMGGIELGAKFKRVLDKNRGQISNAADDRETRDSGYTLTAGNQLFGDLYGALSYGRYTRDIRTPGLNIDNEKSIAGIRLSYNLAGFETGLLSQWVSGKGDPGETGTRADIKQYRMKAFVKAIF